LAAKPAELLSQFVGSGAFWTSYYMFHIRTRSLFANLISQGIFEVNSLLKRHQLIYPNFGLLHIYKRKPTHFCLGHTSVKQGG